MQRTLALIKPDACGRPWLDRLMVKNEEAEDEEAPAFIESAEQRSPDKALEIIQAIKQNGLNIVQQKQLQLTEAQAQAFYAEHKGKTFFGGLTAFMSSGPIMALVLEKEGAIAAWRKLMGPTNSIAAKQAAEAEHPLDDRHWSLRAKFGTDGQQNATHGSDSEFSALREIEFFFPSAQRFERTVAVLSESAAASTDKIVADLEARDFILVAQKQTKLSSEDVAALAKRSGAAASDAVAKALGGSVTALIIEGRGVQKRLQLLAGPPEVDVAKANHPLSLRARYSSDSDGVVLYCSQTLQSVEEDVDLCFPDPLPIERTLAMVKPGTADAHGREIKQIIMDAGFTILAEKKATLSRDDCEEFYGEHKGKPFFEGLVRYMSTGSIIALALAKPAAVHTWRYLCGPTNPAVARVEVPNSIRARFGSENPKNAVHGSDSTTSSKREIHFFFPTLRPDVLPSSTEVVEDVKTRVMGTVQTPMGPMDKTLHLVLVEGLTALCKAKPSGLDAIRWIGQWLIDNNPRHGRVTNLMTPRAGGGGAPAGPRVELPHDDARHSESKMEEAEVISTEMNQDESWPEGLQPKSIVFVLGGPGSGKGTQCDKISQKFGYTHLSTGDLLRAEVASGSPLGKELAQKMEKGELVKTETVLGLLKKAMRKSGSDRFLVDGYPRRLDQAFAFERLIGEPSFVLSFDASDEILQRRLEKRGESSGRSDDNPESIAKRIKIFHEESEDVIEFYAKVGKLRRVSSESSVEEVFDDVQGHFHPEVVFVLGGLGAGKGTQCKKIAAEFGYYHVSTGDLLRDEVASGSRTGAEVSEIMQRGDLVPIDILMKLLRARLEVDPLGRYLIDGFPRTLEQVAMFEEHVAPARMVLQLDVTPAVGKARVLGRGRKSGRSDNTVRAFNAQQRVYTSQTGPVLDMYSALGLVHKVDANGTEDAVWEAVKPLFHPDVVFVLGGPGSGKGTQCAKIAAEFGFTHLSAGDLLRAEVARGSSHGAMIQEYMTNGQIVPVSVTLRLLQKSMRDSSIGSANGGGHFLVDGFPRAMDQALAFESDVCPSRAVLFFDLSEAEMRARLLERAKTSGRADDNEETIVKRFKTFVETSFPVINYYGGFGKVFRADSSKSIDEVYADTRPLFAPEIVLCRGAGALAAAPLLAADLGNASMSLQAAAASELARQTGLGKRISSLGGVANMDASSVIRLVRSVAEATNAQRLFVAGLPESADVIEALQNATGLQKATRAITFGAADSAETKALHGFGIQNSNIAAQPAAAVAADAAKLFAPRLVVLIGASGSGRGEFSRNAGRMLGYQHLRMTHLLQAEAQKPTELGREVNRALQLKQTVSLSAAIQVLKEAIRKSRCNRFLLDGFPRVVSDGFPAIHDQVLGLQEGLGEIHGVICLDAKLEQRRSRITGNPTVGMEAALTGSVDTYLREKLPTAAYMKQRHGNLVEIDTSGKEPATILEQALPILE